MLPEWIELVCKGLDQSDFGLHDQPLVICDYRFTVKPEWIEIERKVKGRWKYYAAFAC